MPVIIECESILVEKVGHVVGVNGGLAGPFRSRQTCAARSKSSMTSWKTARL